MRIERFRVSSFALPGGRRGNLVHLTDDRGNVGVGEASPLAGYSPDDIDGCAARLHDAASRIDEIADDVASIEAALAGLDPTLDRAPASRFAVETALFDLVAMRRGVPLSILLNENARERVAVNGVLGMHGNADDWISSARALVERNIRTIKVKIGRSGDFDRELLELALLRASLPADVELRLDANGLLGEGARQSMRRLAPLRPSFVEEPVAGEALVELGRCSAPWAADESLSDPALAARLLDAEGCAAIVLKPAILGGISRCLRLASLARARGLGVVVTHLFDGNVAHAACCELALALEMPLACGLDHHVGLSRPSAHLHDDGFVTASGRHGIGIAA